MKGEAFVPVLNPGMITISITLANLMQGVEQHNPQCQCMWRQRPHYGRSRLINAKWPAIRQKPDTDNG